MNRGHGNVECIREGPIWQQALGYDSTCKAFSLLADLKQHEVFQQSQTLP